MIALDRSRVQRIFHLRLALAGTQFYHLKELYVQFGVSIERRFPINVSKMSPFWLVLGRFSALAGCDISALATV